MSPPRAISRCSTELGYHAHMAGPCFDTEAEAVAFRDACEYTDACGINWRDHGWPLSAPDGWMNPLDAEQEPQDVGA